MESQYTKEQEALEREMDGLTKLTNTYDDSQQSADKFIALVKRYHNFEEMTNTMLNEFVYKIFVHERDQKGRQDSPQTIEIYFNFIGKFEMPHDEKQPTPEEIEMEKRCEEIRQKRHEQYLRRKESGWQKAYYEKTKQAKKAAIDAAKDAIRKEDQANGVYYLPNAKYAAEAREKEAVLV